LIVWTFSLCRIFWLRILHRISFAMMRNIFIAFLVFGCKMHLYKIHV
jgi:hypothetical protein